MAKQKSDIKILLMQIRDETSTRREELESFAQYSDLAVEQFDILNLFDTPDFEDSVLDGYDALYVGGSSEASVLEPENYPFVIPAQALLRTAIERKLPVFASCFGHQLAVKALGGDIVRDEKDFEMGTIPIYLNECAKNDPLYRDVSDGFLAVSVHRERTTEPPVGCTQLAYTDACCHAFKVDDAPFWTTQFHPEVDLRVLIERLTVFKEKYTDGDGHLQQVLDAAEETPQSNNLLKSFVDRVLLG
ncbi:MAG: type 1 glutamine amidotransferase [Motiliproteus sp.]|nr:type 1 glutamine amidotransferase [Motiliproteus sp.]MCW9052842.1 type 1 glutamine amidotransferase [Motiliproteus sp.]